MIRLLIFFLWVLFFAAALTLLLSVGSEISAEAFGWRFDIPAGAAFGIILALIALVIGATSVVKDVVDAPKRLRSRRLAARKEKGFLAITRGLEAIAAGDGAAARRQGETAMRLLGPEPAVRLLAAQAAQFAGDEAAADEALAGLLEGPETRLLGLRALFAKAMRRNDRSAARRHAADALALQPRARWALLAFFDLALEDGDFKSAEDALARALKSHAIDAEPGRRGIAALATAQAYSAYAAGDAAGALSAAQQALKSAADFAPAAIIAARLNAAKGDPRKAQRILTDACQGSADAALFEELGRCLRDQPEAAQAEALEALAAANPGAAASQIARAQAALLRDDSGAATEILSGVLSSGASAGALRLMAAAQARRNGDAAARRWLDRAAAARPDDALGAEDYFRITPDGWRRLVREFMDHGRLAPPGLRQAPAGIPDDEMTALLATPEPVMIAAETAPADAPNTDEMLDAEAAAARGVN